MKKGYIFALSALAAASVFSTSQADGANRKVRKVYMHTTQQYASFNQMVESADLIAIVTTKTPFTNARTNFLYSKLDKSVLDFDSRRSYRIQKLIFSNKDVHKNDNVIIQEDVALSQPDKNGISTEFHMIDYSPMEVDTKYLIFAKLEPDGSYRIFNGKFGKFNTTSKDSDEDTQKLKWKDRALLKFNQ